jgi:endonuclease/exonuclease/phosphatase (EEP) superfamily protein YafD
VAFTWRSLPSLLRKDAWLAVLTVGYSLALVAFAALLRCVGERSTLTTIALYLPRWPLGLPLPVLLFALVRRRRPGLLALPVSAGLCWLFVLLGLRLGSPRSPTPGRHLLRVLSFNVDSDPHPALLVSALRAAHADLIVLEERGDDDAGFWETALGEYDWVVQNQFAFGSRFPIVEVSQPFRHGASYVRFRVRLPEGLVDLYALHPPSPRLSMSELLAKRVRRDPARLLQASRDISANARDRVRQLGVVADDARSSRLPVIIAGDTNLPDLSPALARTFSDFQDAFRQVGRGFGYTFPTDRRWVGPWMRIDRVFVNQAFRVLDFATLPPAGSDHLGILAVLEL